MKSKETNFINRFLANILIFTVLFNIMLPGLTYASTYDSSTNTVSPSLVNDNTSVAYNTYGFSDDNGEEFVNDTDIALDGLNFSGSIADIRSALVYMYEYISNSHTGTTALKGTLASIDKLTLNINGDAKITPNDLGYIKFLTNYVENKNDPEINVNVAGNVTFDSGTGDYNDENIKDVITDKFTLSASGTITLPNGSDVNEFFGSGKVVKNNTVIADGKEYITNENNNFISASTIRIDGLTSLYTGILKDFKINLTNSGTAKQVKAIITLSGITTDDIALLQYYEGNENLGIGTGWTSDNILISGNTITFKGNTGALLPDKDTISGSLNNDLHVDFRIQLKPSAAGKDFDYKVDLQDMSSNSLATNTGVVNITKGVDVSVSNIEISTGILGNFRVNLSNSGAESKIKAVVTLSGATAGDITSLEYLEGDENSGNYGKWVPLNTGSTTIEFKPEGVSLLPGIGYVDFSIEVSESGALNTLDYTIDLVSLSESNSGTIIATTSGSFRANKRPMLARLPETGTGTATESFDIVFFVKDGDNDDVDWKISYGLTGSLTRTLTGTATETATGQTLTGTLDLTGLSNGTIYYEVSVDDKHGGTRSFTGSFEKNVPSLTLSKINVNSLDTPLTLTSTGTISDDFGVTIVSNSYSGTEVLTSVKITTNSGDLSKVKLWNTAFPNDELLGGSGEYLGIDSQKYALTDTGANFRVEFGAAGTYIYEIKLVEASNTGNVVSEISTGSVVVNPYVEKTATLQVNGLDSLKEGEEKEFNITLTNTGSIKNVYAEISLSGITLNNIEYLEFYEGDETATGTYQQWINVPASSGKHIFKEGGVPLSTGSSLVNFRIKLKTGITANSFDYQISLKDKTNSGELASASGSVTITKDIPYQAPTIGLDIASANIYVTGSLFTEDGNGKVTNFNSGGLTPYNVTLTGANTDLEKVRLVLSGSNLNNLQLIAQDTNGDYYNIVKSGWGPLEGFKLASGSATTTPVYAVASSSGTYIFEIRLIDVNNSSALLAVSTPLTITASVNPPIVNTVPIIAFTGATIGTGFITTNDVSTNIEVTDSDTDNISLMYSLNNGSGVLAGSITGPVTHSGQTINLNLAGVPNGPVNYQIWANDGTDNSNILTGSFIKSVPTSTGPVISFSGSIAETINTNIFHIDYNIVEDYIYDDINYLVLKYKLGTGVLSSLPEQTGSGEGIKGDLTTGSANSFDLDLTAFPYEEKINYEFWLIGSGGINNVESNHLTGAVTKTTGPIIDETATLQVNGLTSVKEGEEKDFNIILTNTGSMKNVYAEISLTGITLSDVEYLQFYEGDETATGTYQQWVDVPTSNGKYIFKEGGVILLTGSSLVNFRIKLKTGITANSFDYQISLKNKTNSGELASKTGSVIITKDTLTTLSIISVNSLSGSLTLLTSTGTASDDFDVNIVANSYSGTEVLTSVKITTNSGDLSKVKLWNTAFLDNELLGGNGEYLGTDSQKYALTDTGANFRVEFGAAGTYTYEIKLVEASNTGNVVSEISTGSVVVNPYIPPVNIPPTINYRNATLSGSIVNNNNLTIFFIVTDPDTNTSDVELWYKLNNDAAQPATGSMTGSLVGGEEVYLNLDLTGFPDGNNISYEFWIHDKIANADSNVLSGAFLKDTRIKLVITPNSTIKSPTNITTIPLSFKISNQAVDSVNWNLEYELTGSGVMGTGSGTVAGATTSTGAIVNFNLDLTSISNQTGTIVYRINADDLSGGTGSLTGSFTFDGISPVVTMVNTLSGTIANLTPSFSFEVNEDIASYIVSCNTGVITQTGGALSAGTGTHMFSTLSDGNYSCEFKVTDLAGNDSSAETMNFVIDTSSLPNAAPRITQSGTIVSPTNITSVPLSIIVVDDENNSVLVTANYGLKGSGTIFTTTGSTTGSTSGSGEIVNLNLDLTSITTDGIIDYEINAVDVSGSGSNTLTGNFILDRTAPVVAIPNPLSGIITTATPSFNFTVNENIANYIVRCPASAINETRGGLTAGTGTFAFPSLSNRAYSCELQATDLAGNVSNVVTMNFTINVSTPTPPPSYGGGGGGGYTSSNAPKLSTNSGTSVAESADKSQKIEVSYPAWIRTLTNTYNKTFDDAYIMPDGTYRYMYQTLSGYIQEIPFNSSISVKVTDKELNENSKVYIKTQENGDWALLTNYKLNGNTIEFTTDKGFVLRIVNGDEEGKLDTPIIPTIPEIGYEDKVSSGSGVNISAIIESHYDVKVSYVVNRIIIPGNGEAHFAEVNAFLKTVNDTMNLAERVEYLASYLPQLALEIEAETDKVQKERLKILYVLGGKAYNVYYKRLNTFK